MDEVNPLVLNKIKKVAAGGAIITGTKPAKAVGWLNKLKGDEAVKKVADQSWIKTGGIFNKELIGKGKVLLIYRLSKFCKALTSFLILIIPGLINGLLIMSTPAKAT